MADGSAAEHNGRGPLVLIADDDEGLRLLLVVVLGQIGVEVLVASDGVGAVRLALEHRALLSCAILDVHMPVLDGLGAARAIREIAPGLVILMMGTYFPPGHRQQIASLGIAHILEKPFHLSELCGRVQDISAP